MSSPPIRCVALAATTARATLEFDERPNIAAMTRRPRAKELQIKNHTRVISLLVSLRFRSSRESVLQGLANFGIGTLVPSLQGRFAARCLLGKLDLGGRDQDLGAGLEIGRFQQRLLLGRPVG